ncbi:MAG: SLC13 family permease [Nocardioidaceae bacterium]|nr:SLC13 family permease [Nocardioidaceae bacterium]
MSTDVIALVVLALVFLVASVRGANMGALALVASFVVGLTVYSSSTDDILGGFPGDLFVILVGVTYLFALAKNNGTVDWIVHGSVRLVGGRVALVPWAMFVVSAIVTGIGAVSPAAVAIIAPIALRFASRYRIHPVLMGMMVVQGATGGSFSPIGIFGSITNGVVSSADLDGSPAILFFAALAASLTVATITFLAFGGRELLSRGREEDELADVGADAARTSAAATRGPVTGTPGAAQESTRPSPATESEEESFSLNGERIFTLLGLVALVVGALGFDLDVGFTALTIAVILTLVFPASAKGAVDKIAWGTVLLIGGIVTYVTLLETEGTIAWLGDRVAEVGAPLVAALLICFIGALVSAFASTTGIIGTLIPLAVPFLLTDQVNAIALVTALAISSSVVDCSPFSTNGALVVANTAEDQRDMVFKRLMQWGMSIVVLAPLVTWTLLVLPTT